MMLDQHMLVVIIALSTQAQAPTGVQVHRLERLGAGFARHEWFSPLLLVHFLSCSLSSLANLCWASCMSREGWRLQTMLLSTINIKKPITFKRSKGCRGLTLRLHLLLALVLVLCASSWRSCRWSTTRRCYDYFDTGRPDQLLSQLHDIGIFLSFCCCLQDFEWPGPEKVVVACDVGWQR